MNDEALLQKSLDELETRLAAILPDWPGPADSASPGLQSRLRREAEKDLRAIMESSRELADLARDIENLFTGTEILKVERRRLIESAPKDRADKKPITLRMPNATTTGSFAESGTWARSIELSGRIERMASQTVSMSENRMLVLSRMFRKRFPLLERELFMTVDRWSKSERRYRDFFGTSARGWDLEKSDWRSIDWNVFENAENFARRFPELHTLAQRIGRGKKSPLENDAPPSARAGTPQPGNKIPKLEPSGADRPKILVEVLGRAGISGYTQGRDLELLPPMELTLFADEICRDIFLKQYAETKLTNFDYVRSVEHLMEAPPPSLQELPTPAAGVSSNREPDGKSESQKGPVIICMDTSGSMTGIPEEVARAIVVPTVRSCIAEGRGVYLIAFSTEIRTLDLSNPSERLPELAEFLGMSFRGGTDLRPALAESLRLLDTATWREADLLIVSDFRVPKIMIKRSRLIEAVRREKGAGIHALSITSEAPTDDLHIFDTRWHFRIDARGNPVGISESQFREAGA